MKKMARGAWPRLKPNYLSLWHMQDTHKLVAPSRRQEKAAFIHLKVAVPSVICCVIGVWACEICLSAHSQSKYAKICFLRGHDNALGPFAVAEVYWQKAPANIACVTFCSLYSSPIQRERNKICASYSRKRARSPLKIPSNAFIYTRRKEQKI